MILNFYYILNLNIFLFVLFILCNIHSFKFFEISYLSNLLFKLTLDDFSIFNYYYIWSNFFLMFIILSLISLIFFSTKSLFITGKLFFHFSIVLILFFFNIIDYFFLNNYNFYIELFLSNYNVLLLNNINKVHPILLYSSIYYLFFSFLFPKRCLYNIHSNLTVLRFVYTFSVSCLYLSFTLFLGGWWAFQEGSWGGWWDWDVSEVFGLFILINLVKSLHNNYSKVTSKTVYSALLNSFLFLLIFYFFMQLNFSLISHNFNLNPSSNFVSNISYLIYIFFSFIGCITMIYRSRIFFNVNSLLFNSNYGFKHSWIFKVFVFIFLNSIVLFSLFPILSSWLWSNFSIEYSFNIINFHNILILIFIFLLTVYWNLSITNIFTLLVFLFYSFKIIFIMIPFLLFSRQYFIHYISFCLIYMTIIYNSTESSCWLNIYYGFNNNFHYFYNSIKTDSPFLNVSKDFLNLTLSKNKNFNWWYDFSSLDFKTFILFFSNYNFSQIFVHDVEDNIFCTIISSFIENPILNLISFVFFLFLLKQNTKLVIVF